MAKRTRMSEIRFFVDLYAGFLLMGTANEQVVIQSVQIMRILEQLESQGLVTITKDGAQTYYSADVKCFKYLLSELLNHGQRKPMEEVIFINYYTSTYRGFFLKQASALTAEEHAAMLELLTPGKLLLRQIAIMDELIARIEARIADYGKIRTFMEKAETSKLSVEEKIKQLPLGPNIPQTYKKSLRDVLLDLPKALRERELTVGFEHRLKYYYEPYLNTLKSERALMAGLLTKTDGSQ
ncbi:MAG: hypothetical protein FJ146_09220 [Deltaproteobacteria bacterium]|nr:hypothetical protein [Deltaproteobacteria bacterium]